MSSSSGRFGKKRRVPIVDGVRGVMIVYVAFYHLLFDLVLFRLLPAGVLSHPAVTVTHFLSYSTFVAFSGVSSRFSHSNLRRGAQMLAIGYGITLVTWLLDHEVFVRFGVLHFLGVAAMLFEAMEWLWKRLHPTLPTVLRRAWDVVFPLAMLAAYGLAHTFLYQRSYPVAGLAWLGFPDPAYASSDYFPLVPFLFLYLFGAWLGRQITEERLPGWFYRLRIPGFEVIGRYTLWIYLAHQPLFYALAWLLAAL